MLKRFDGQYYKVCGLLIIKDASAVSTKSASSLSDGIDLCSLRARAIGLLQFDSSSCASLFTYEYHSSVVGKWNYQVLATDIPALTTRLDELIQSEDLIDSRAA